MLENRVVGGYW